MSKPLFNRVLIIGLGLIGGSLARALMDRGLSNEIIAYDKDDTSLDYALAHGYVNQISHTLSDSIPNADLIIWALPVNAICTELTQYRSLYKKGQIITDVGSVKQSILTAAKNIPTGTHFIGGHPMAGKECSGLSGADPELFAGRPWVLVAPENAEQAAIVKLVQLVSGIGAYPVQMFAAEHDKTVALLSHLPQLISSCLMNTVGDLVGELPSKYRLAAGGLSDTTRIAGSNPEMWRDICLANRDELLRLLDAYTTWLNEIRHSLAEQDSDSLESQLQSARSKKQCIQTAY